ncbi:predicted protein [Chaetoceros tenuissimus]|uniref:MYND-type domain-containing protein n=1 Tax=Chaetoceros tenuissimus TaxID=426638 RepID=A0AAD3D172_9STRA|nr:predicted protein [Chaetoceros tenuissimus]
MGKKGKRNRQKGETGRQAREKRLVDSFYARLDKVQAETILDQKSNLFSKVMKELEECIDFIETKQDAIFRLEKCANNHQYFFYRVSFVFSYLVIIYYRAYKYEKITAVVEKFLLMGQQKGNDTTKILLSNQHSFSLIFFSRLSKLREGETTVDDCISQLNSWSSIIAQMEDSVEDITHAMMEAAVTELMLMKEFDKAVVVGKKMEQLTGDKMALARIYFEQYRLGICDHSLIHNFMPCPLDDDYIHKDGFNQKRYSQDLLVHAQWDFVFHKEASRMAVLWIEAFVQVICKDRNCGSCMQAVTDSDVPFVCGGCRVTCYCSLDHQRLNWKKDPLRGMRIGHKLLCPMMNAYRKWRQAEDVGNEEAVKKLRRRFLMEILYFLCHGLGLEEKCCQEEV